MEPYQFGMITGEVTNVDDAIGELDTAWENLDASFVACSDAKYKGGNTACVDLESKQANYFKKYHDYTSKLEGSNELSGQYKELNDKALMRPINISFGIMILLALISDLTVGFG
jgi:hypothetical protein